MFGQMYESCNSPFRPADLAEKNLSQPQTWLCATVWLTLDVCLQFYSVLDGDEDMIFMHVDNPGGAVSCFLTSFSILWEV